jgi:hypothetical protein
VAVGPLLFVGHATLRERCYVITSQNLGGNTLPGSKILGAGCLGCFSCRRAVLVRPSGRGLNYYFKRSIRRAPSPNGWVVTRPWPPVSKIVHGRYPP